eukprot:TRINITY_DN15906_c0_g2_i2.p1 TRINITY_DN15906_c0_g2~~TRINITY_DN15906_c0_g2_i2.p1  ORF type:complete len:367 (-),score=82.50 TRINITY_DN15906_c0_g2_i2:14-1114(-)
MSSNGGKGKGPARPQASSALAGEKGKGKGFDKEESEVVHTACQFDDEAVILDFVERNERPLDPNTCLRRGLTPLHTSAVNNSVRVTRILLARGARTAVVNIFGETPLHLAVAAGNGTIVDELLAARADVEAKDKWGRTPFRVASENGYTKVVEQLRSAGAVDAAPVGSATGGYEAGEARKTQQQNLMQEFMGRVQDQPPKTATQEPIVKGIFQPSNNQASATAGPTDGPAASSAGGVGGPMRALSKLVEYPGDPEAIKRHLADPTVNPAGRDMFSLTAFHKFAAWDKVDLLELLSPHLEDEDVNAVGGDDGFSALHHAVSMGAVHTLRMLLKDPRIRRDVKDRTGRTPRELAAKTRGMEGLVTLFD